MKLNAIVEMIRRPQHALLLAALVSGSALAQPQTTPDSSLPAEGTVAQGNVEVKPAKEAAAELDSVEVTGSRIRRVDLERASPVFVIDRSAIETSGVATLGQLLQEMPSIAGAATNPQVNNGGGDGSAKVSLRGLGEDRTLLLLNGRRIIAQDVNSIPINLIERVEVLKDGASAIYGSDAIGGVVNFITRKNYTGSEFVASYGISQEGDGARTNYWTTVGMGSDAGSVNFGLNFDRQNKISAADREFSKDPFSLYYGQEISQGSSRAPRGRYVVTRAAAEGAGVDTSDPSCPPPSGMEGETVTLTRRTNESPGTSGSDFRCFIGGGPNNDTFDFQDDNVVLTPQQRFGVFVQGTYQLPRELEFFSEAFFQRNESNFQIAPEPFDGRPAFADVPIDRNNVYNIFGNENPAGQDITDVRLRLTAVGNRTEKFEVARFQWTGGLKGNLFDDAWRWDLYTTLAQENLNSEAFGEIFTEGARRALGPSFDRDPSPGVQDPVCGTPGPDAANPSAGANETPGCVPLNFLGIPDKNGLTNIAPFVHDRQEGKLQVVAFNINGNVEQVQLPGGALGVAAGVEYRKESLETQPDFLRVTGLISGQSSSPIRGEFDVNELYTEFLLPVLADLPFAEMLNISLGVRYSDYSSFGETVNGKIGVEYRPLNELLLRANYAQVFRAPTIRDLFGGENESADSFDDPCNNTPVSETGSEEFQRGCRGVPTTDARDPNDVDGDGEEGEPDGNIDYQQSDSQLRAVVGGNPNLQPEEGDTYTLGFVYSPNWYDPLTIEVDYWNFTIGDTIKAIGANQRLNQCFNQGLFCDSIERDETGEISRVRDAKTNTGELQTSGIDMGFKFNFGELAWDGRELGRFTYGLDATYLIEYNNQQIDGDPNTEVRSAGRFQDTASGGDGNFPRWRALSSIGWKIGDLSAVLASRYIHSVTENPGDPGCGATDQPGGVCEREVESNLINDVQVAYSIPGFNTEASVGIDNFTNELAPLIYSGFNGTTDVRTYDAVGRFFWARVKYSF